MQEPLQPLPGARRFLETVIRRHATDPLAKLAADERGLLWKYRHWISRQAGSLAAMLKAIDWLDPAETSMVLEQLIPQWPRLQGGLAEVIHLLASLLEAEETRRSSSLVDVRPTWRLTLPRTAFECLFAACWWPIIGEATPAEATLYLPQLLLLYELHPIWGDWWLKQAAASPCLAGLLFWQLRVLSKQQKGAAGESHAVQLLGSLLHGVPERASEWLRQEDLFTALTTQIQRIGREQATRPQREQALRRWLQDPEQAALLLLLLLPSQPLLLPPLSQPVCGLRVEAVRIFKSAAMPVLLPLIRQADLGVSGLILKLEDLSQDQLVLQLIRIVDGEWRRHGLDLRLTPYQAMPVGLAAGVVEYVPAAPLAAILAEYGSLTAYMRIKSKGTTTTTPTGSRLYSPPPFDALPIDPSIMDNWIRSCAGYTILTYVLGVGDRHLENLLLGEDGRLVHIDFAHLFGEDPKPFAPPVKLCREMVEAMGGGPGSPAYLHFKALCYTAFSLLRRHAGCLLAPLALLRGPEAMQWVAKRLALQEQHEEQALIGMEEDLEASVNALFPQVMETIHRWAQYWRH